MRFQILQLDARIVNEKRTILTAIYANTNELVGSVQLEFAARRVAEFSWLFVVVERTGIGSALVRECERIAKAAGCESISGFIDPGNHAVVGFYLKLGYMLAAEWNDGTLLIAKTL